MASIVAPYIPSKHGDPTAAHRVVARSLARAGFGNLRYATRIRRKWDDRLTTLLNQWRATVGIKNRAAEYTKEDHQKLARWWDKYNHVLARQELARRASASKEDVVRARVIGKLEYLYNRRFRTPYSQARPYDTSDTPRRLDCSASKAWADLKAGAPPTGPPGFGNTWSQLAFYRAKGRVIVEGRGGYSGIAKPGDAVYYGGPTHVTVYLGGGRCFSFGSYPMKLLPVDYRGDRTAICSLL
jgi:cell wall-associated NlpC family hydrolase